MSRRLWFALAAVAVAFAPTAGRAEVAGFPASAEVRGQIVDEAGGPVFGADVIVARPDGSARRAAISDAQGRFTVSGGEAGRVVVTVIAGRGARVATETLDLAPGATALLRVRDDAGKGTLAVTSAETELPGQVLAADCIQQTGAKTPALSRQGDVAGALAALPEAGPATAPAGAPVLAGLPLSEVAVSFEGFSLSDPIDGDVPAELPLSVLGAVAVEAGPVPSVALRAPTIERKQTALSGGLALARGARGADDLARPRGVTGGWDFALRRDSTGRWGRGTVAFSPRHQIWEADPTSVRAARGRKQRTIPLLLWGESELAGWHVRGGLLGLLTTRHYGRGGHVLASGDPIDGVAHQRNWGLVGVNAGRDIGRGDHVGLSLGVLRTTREESLAALPAHESTGTTVSGATNVTVSGSLAGEHRLNGGLGFTLSTGERTGLSASRQPGLLLTDATARVFRPYLALSERYAPSLHLEVEAGFGLALASFSGSSKVEGGATLERSFRGRLWFAPHGRLSVRPLVGPSVLGIHVMAARTPGKLPLLALMDATSGPRVELPLPAQDALALAADLSTRRLHLRLMAQTRRDATVLEDRFAAATGQPELFAPAGARRTLRALSLVGETRRRAVRVGASAVLARLSGNHSGAIDEATGQLRPWVTPAFDGPDVDVNRSGRLPYDRPYGLRAYVTGRLENFAGWDASALVRGQLDAGTPLSATGRSAASGEGQVFLVPRGSVGRTRTHTSFDVALRLARRLPQADARVWLALEGFGFAWRRPVSVRDSRFADEILTPEAAAGREPAPGYGRALAYAEPLTLRLQLGVGF